MINRTSQQWIKLLKNADLFIYGLTRGTILLTPRSQKMWELIIREIDQRFAKIGIENVAFPALIPLSEFQKEKINFAGFSPELLLVNQIGEKKLDLANIMALRPTSEVVFSHYFQNKMESYRDLPILINQWANVWRWEKNTYPFLRTTEFFWQEGHGVFSDETAAKLFFQKINNIYHDFIENVVLIPTFFGKKSEMERFAGATETWTHETILPDGQFLQLATTHDLGQNFSRIFDLKFLNKENKKMFPEQGSWGMSTRILAAMFLTHADEKGLILPPAIADHQIWIIPFYKKENTQKINEYSSKILNFFIQKGIRIKLINLKNKSSGFWINEFEKQGIPIRIEIGEKELNQKNISYKIRINGNGETLSLTNFLEKLPKIFQKIANEMQDIANKNLFQKKKNVETYHQFKKIESKNQAYFVNFCTKKSCEKKIQMETNTTSRLIYFDKQSEKCFFCGEKPAFKTIFGRSY